MVKGAYMVKGVCMVKGDMCGEGACVVKGHVWQQGACVVKGACMVMGHVWQGACMVGGHAWLGHAWQGGMHGRGACVAGETATAAGGMDCTGIHSCSKCISITILGWISINIDFTE